MIFDNLRMTDLKQGSNCLSHSHLGQGACFCLFSVVVVLFCFLAVVCMTRAVLKLDVKAPEGVGSCSDVRQ